MENNQSTTWPMQLTANYDYNENILNSLGLLLNYYTEKHGKTLVARNGNLVKSYHHVFVSAEQFWGSTICVSSAGLVDHCTASKSGVSHENGIMIRRCDDNYTDRYCAVQQQVSYIAKAKDKGEPNDGLRDFGMSRLPMLPNH